LCLVIDMSDERHKRRIQLLTEEEIFGETRAVTDIDLGLLQMQILWVLSRKSAHGYDLMKDLSKLKNMRITQGTLYPTLHKLVEQELVRREEAGRRVIYHVTPKGSRVMHDTCLDFCRTFYGIYQDFVCSTCVEHQGTGRKKG